MDFSNNTMQRPFDFEFARKMGGGGLGYVFLTVLDDMQYYGYNTDSNNSAWKGFLGVLPQKFFIRISTKSCNSRQF